MKCSDGVAVQTALKSAAPPRVLWHVVLHLTATARRFPISFTGSAIKMRPNGTARRRHDRSNNAGLDGGSRAAWRQRRPCASSKGLSTGSRGFGDHRWARCFCVRSGHRRVGRIVECPEVGANVHRVAIEYCYRTNLAPSRIEYGHCTNLALSRIDHRRGLTGSVENGGLCGLEELHAEDNLRPDADS